MTWNAENIARRVGTAKDIRLANVYIVLTIKKKKKPRQKARTRLVWKHPEQWDHTLYFEYDEQYRHTIIINDRWTYEYLTSIGAAAGARLCETEMRKRGLGGLMASSLGNRCLRMHSQGVPVSQAWLNSGMMGEKTRRERDMHYMMLFIAVLREREGNITPCIPHSSICHIASKQTITNNQ